MKANTYIQLREDIRSGDCILWQGKGFVSWLIQKWTDYSHASIVVRFQEAAGLGERVYMVEALAGGLTFTLLSERVKHSKGRVFLFQPHCLWESSQQMIRHDVLGALARGVKYDYKGLFANLFGRVSNNASRYFCSEFVWVKWGKGGVLGNGNLTDAGAAALKRNKAPRPGDIPLWVNGELTEITKE